MINNYKKSYNINIKCSKKFRTLPKSEEWIIYTKNTPRCDNIASTCSMYVIRSLIVQQIIIAFRGTQTISQLIMESSESLLPQLNFYGIGYVSLLLYWLTEIICIHKNEILIFNNFFLTLSDIIICYKLNLKNFVN